MHIGCEKTGSSALQLWLHQNATCLLENGIYYPTFTRKITDQYTITSGNGADAVKAINKERGARFFEHLFAKRGEDVLLSSEQFQSLTDQQLVGLKSLFESLEIEPVVIVFLRDVYDMLYSKYNQLVKRHFFEKSFSEYIYSLKEVEQISVVDKWSRHFSQINVLHYNSNKKNLDSAFLKVLGLNECLIQPMKKVTVNRSLNFFEIELMRMVNTVYNKKFYKKNYDFPEKITNKLIKNSPEKSVSIFYDKKVEQHIAESFSGDIDRVNKEYFNGKKILQVFDKGGKLYSENIPTIESEYKIILEEIIDSQFSLQFWWRNYLENISQKIKNFCL